MEDHPFESFVHSLAAARLLLLPAQQKGSLIEGLVLYATLIDALLRNLVALRTGEREGTTIHLDLRYFYHDDSMWMSERKVYAAAHACGVLTDTELRELEGLYRFRNSVIHRFVISEIKYADIAKKLDQYEVIFNRLYQQLHDIEQPDGFDYSDEERRKWRERIVQKLEILSGEDADA